jgi:hypothetical protein
MRGSQHGQTKEQRFDMILKGHGGVRPAEVVLV